MATQNTSFQITGQDTREQQQAAKASFQAAQKASQRPITPIPIVKPQVPMEDRAKAAESSFLAAERAQGRQLSPVMVQQKQQEMEQKRMAGQAAFKAADTAIGRQRPITPVLSPEIQKPEEQAKAGEASFQAAQRATKAPKPIDTMVEKEEPIDVENKTFEDINQELTQRAEDRFLKRVNAINQSRSEELRTKIAQDGLLGEGAGNALMSQLMIANSLGTAQGIDDIQTEALGRALSFQSTKELTEQNQEFQRQQIEQSGLINMFNSFDNPEDRINFAKEMADVYPDNPLWDSVANNPDIQEGIRNSLEPQDVARRTQFSLLAQDAVASIVDPFDEGQVADNFNLFAENFRNARTDGDLKISSQRWFNDPNTDRAEINELASKYGMDMNNPNEEIVKEMWIEKKYNENVNFIQKEFLSNDLSDGVVTSNSLNQDEFRPLLKSGFGMLVDDKGNINIEGLSGEGVSDPTGTKWEFMFSDWDGIDYNETDNRNSLRDNRNQNLDNLWVEYARQAKPGENLIDRDSFEETVRNFLDIDTEVFDPNSAKVHGNNIRNAIVQNQQSQVPQAEVEISETASQFGENAPTAEAILRGEKPLESTGELTRLLADDTKRTFVDSLVNNNIVERRNTDDLRRVAADPTNVSESGIFNIRSAVEGTAPDFIVIDGDLYKVETTTDSFKKTFTDLEGGDDEVRTARQGIFTLTNLSAQSQGVPVTPIEVKTPGYYAKAASRGDWESRWFNNIRD